MDQVCDILKVSERRACRVLDQVRATQQYRRPEDLWEKRLIERMTYWAVRMGRLGYKKITDLLRAEGWRVNKKRIHRLWRQERA